MVTARLKNNSPLTILRIDVDIVMARLGQLIPVAHSRQTILFAGGIDQSQSHSFQFSLEDPAMQGLLEQSDLELMLRPTKIHVADKTGNVHIANMHGVATIITRDWLTPSSLTPPATPRIAFEDQ